MSAGLGMDLVRIERIRRVLDDHPERFRARVFTPTECRDAADRGAGEVASLAARFAAKEAALKAARDRPRLRNWLEGCGSSADWFWSTNSVAPRCRRRSGTYVGTFKLEGQFDARSRDGRSGRRG